jgi:hypothetical protein
MKKHLTDCPVCGSLLKVSEYSCGSCKTRIKGDFVCENELGGFDKEILEFIKVFVYAEGSIKQVEKLMNCSYPKVKNLLKKAKAALDIEEAGEDNSQVVLELLSKGEITTEEALEKLSKGRQS